MPDLNDLANVSLPFLSNPALQIEGELKAAPEDFVVEEIPAYFPCGEGEHLFLRIEKRDISAEQLQQHISKSLHLRRNEIGMAGLKDRRAVTRQWLSVPSTCQSALENVDTDQIRLLEAIPHKNKLKTGHCRGNRFEITLRTETPHAAEIAMQIRAEVLEKGIPNYFGTQRFGHQGETLTTGYQLLTGSLDANQIPPRRRKFLKRLALSAVQSALFNAVLAERLQEQIAHTVLLGDVLQKLDSGGPFVSTDPETDQKRFAAREIITTGPLFGPKMKTPSGAPLELETQICQRYGLAEYNFTKFRKLTPGTRRPLLLWLDELVIDVVPQGIRFQFHLPSGAYATTLLREFTKEMP